MLVVVGGRTSVIFSGIRVRNGGLNGPGDRIDGIKQVTGLRDKVDAPE